MHNDEIIFLDTKIINNNGSLHLEMYKKPQASQNVINYKSLVSPISFKIYTLVSELYRCNYTRSTPEALDLALNDTKKKFLKTSFPLNSLTKK